MAFQTWVTLANAYQPSGITTGNVKTSKVLAALSPGGTAEPLVIPANFLQAGNILRYTACGFYSTKAAVKPTLTLGLYINKLEAGKAMAATEALETEAAQAEKTWSIEANSRVVTGGEKGKIITTGRVHGIVLDKASAKVGAQVNHLPATKAGAELEVNFTTACPIFLGATWSEESAENTITCTQWLVEILN